MKRIYLQDPITRGSAALVTREVRGYRGPLEVHLSGPGGDVPEGLNIYNVLKPYRPTVFIGSMAVSMHSAIAMVGAHIVAAENTMIMVHLPMLEYVEGANAPALRKLAGVLDVHADALLSCYARTKLPREKLLELLEAETWLTAPEALQLGFVDEVATALPMVARYPAAAFAAFKNRPPAEYVMPFEHQPQGQQQPPQGQQQAPQPQAQQPAPGQHQPPQAQQHAPQPQAAHVQLGQPQGHAAAQHIAGVALSYVRNAGGAGSPVAGEVLEHALAAIAGSASPSVEAFGARALEIIGRGSTPLAGQGGSRETYGAPFSASVSGGTGYGQNDLVIAASDALAIRLGAKIDKPHPSVRDVTGKLSDIARLCLGRAGRSGFDQTPAGMITAALSTGDFPLILQDGLRKVLRKGYEVEPQSHNAWVHATTVPDFKENKRPVLGSAPELLLVLPHGEYVNGSLDEDGSVPFVVSKYGRIVSIAWEALINDDLNAYGRMLQGMGQAAMRREADVVYATLSVNSGNGQTMQDANPLFHASHNNIVGAVSGLSGASIAAAKALLRKQTAVGGGVMNLQPRFLLVGADNEYGAELILAQSSRGVTTGEDNQLAAPWLAQLVMVVEPRLDGSASYLLTGPESVDTLERAHLEADGGPQITMEDGFRNDTKSYKVRHVVGARWLDWRGVVKIPHA